MIDVGSQLCQNLMNISLTTLVKGNMAVQDQSEM